MKGVWATRPKFRCQTSFNTAFPREIGAMAWRKTREKERKTRQTKKDEEQKHEKGKNRIV